MSSPIDMSLMKFPAGLALYMERDGHRLNGITLRKESDPNYREAFWKQMKWTQHFWPVFDITTTDTYKSRKSIVYHHLDNYFNCYVLDLTRHKNPPILESLFVAEGTSADISLQALLDQGDRACALAGSPVSEPVSTSNSSSSTSNSSASNSSTSATATAPAPRAYTYVLDAELDGAYSVDAQQQFMHGLAVYVQMSKSQPQLGGITLRQTPDGLRFSINSHSGTATQIVEHYKRTLCDAPFNFHPLYYIFVENGRYANKSLAQIIIYGMVPGLAGKRMDVPDTYEATWPAVPTAVATTATTETTPVVAPPVATATPEEVLERLRAKHTVLVAEYRLLSNIEAQLQINQNLTNEIARKRKILENPECQ
jgi:hypothetical protein